VTCEHRAPGIFVVLEELEKCSLFGTTTRCVFYDQIGGGGLTACLGL
jgi:hypothetical protein